MSQKSLIVVGGGLIGLATAYRFLQKFPSASVTLLEKEAAVGQHQSGRNSGVLHTGIYYKPGSHRARMCKQGKVVMEQFCTENEVAFERCGKVIVAKDESELGQLQRIYERGQINGIQVELIRQERLREIEPHVRGVKAIHVPEAGVADYPAVSQKLADCIIARGGRVICGAQVVGMVESPSSVTVETTVGDFSAETVVTCAGLHSDRIARMSAGNDLPVQILPFRGEYFQLKPHAEHLCNGLIYPVPDPRFPFLGVHFTKMIEGGVDCGPNAVLATAREGYTKTDFNRRDFFEAIGYKGFQRLALKYWRTGLAEMWRSANKRSFVKALQTLIPAVSAEDLAPHPAGVRAMAVEPSGDIRDDFAFAPTKRVFNVINAPSPGATASLTLGNYIVEQLHLRS